MLAPVRKAKKCRHCRAEFTPVRPLQIVCSGDCAGEIVKAENERKKAAQVRTERKDDRAKREKMKRIPDLIREAQREFNAYIRARDKSQSCICCGNDLGPPSATTGGSFDCGHYRSTGSASHLRFNEDNAHAQRKVCNRYGAGRAVDYRIGLIERIGLAAVEALEADNTPHRWAREELIAIKATYSAKRRALLKQGETA
jgi:predicted nucleic acid-binding Zn ribbon protein